MIRSSSSYSVGVYVCNGTYEESSRMNSEVHIVNAEVLTFTQILHIPVDVVERMT